MSNHLEHEIEQRRPRSGNHASKVSGIQFYGLPPSQFVIVSYPELPADNYPLAVVVHGGFWKGKHGIMPPTAACETLAPDLVKHGFIVVEVEYRRDKDEQWGWPHSNNDVLQAFKLAVNLPHVRKESVSLIGHSAGGTLVLWLAAQLCGQQEYPLPHHTIALAPVADLREAVRLCLSDDGDAVVRYMHGIPEDLSSRYDEACPTHAAGDLACMNVTLVSGTNDVDVPTALVERLKRAIQDAARKLQSEKRGTITFKVLSQANHYDLVLASSAAWESIRGALLNTCLEVERSKVTD